MRPKIEKSLLPPSPRPTRTTRSTAPLDRETLKPFPEYHTYTLSTLLSVASARRFSFPHRNFNTMTKVQLILTLLQQDRFDHNRHLATLSVLPVHKLNCINDEFGSKRQARIIEYIKFERWMAKQKYEVKIAENLKRNEMLMPDRHTVPDEKAFLAQLRENLRDERDEIIQDYRMAIRNLDKEEKERREELRTQKDTERDERGREIDNEREKGKMSRVWTDERRGRRAEEGGQKHKKRPDDLKAQNEREVYDLDNFRVTKNLDQVKDHALVRKRPRTASYQYENLTEKTFSSATVEEKQQKQNQIPRKQSQNLAVSTSPHGLKRRRSDCLFNQGRKSHQPLNLKQISSRQSAISRSDDLLLSRDAGKQEYIIASSAEISDDEDGDSWKASPEENAAWDARGGMRQYSIPGHEKDALSIANLAYLMDRERYLKLAGIEEDDEEDLV